MMVAGSNFSPPLPTATWMVEPELAAAPAVVVVEAVTVATALLLP